LGKALEIGSPVYHGVRSALFMKLRKGAFAGGNGPERVNGGFGKRTWHRDVSVRSALIGSRKIATELNGS